MVVSFEFVLHFSPINILYSVGTFFVIHMSVELLLVILKLQFLLGFIDYHPVFLYLSVYKFEFFFVN